MKIQIIKNNKGFTLVETMFAVMILTFAIVSMMTVVSNSLFAARYGRNEITASYLLQEAIDSIRNDRDTSVFLQNSKTTDVAWADLITKYAPCGDQSRGCYFDVLNSPITPTICPFSGSGVNCLDLYYNDNPNNTSFYVNDDGLGNSDKSKSGFQRKIVVIPSGDEINVTVTVSWKNGGLIVSRSLSTTLMKWAS